ncbi:hypothetical protein [Streptomyces goshikiensis]|uniref:hypothetical protein n=1 Tax=Streptomyces goshikiensis TaxID=1942 RepID=UPI00381EC5FD
MNHRSVRVIGMTAAALAGLAGCGGGKPLDGSAPEPRPSAVPAWDGDHGRDGTAGNVLVLGADGKRLTAQRI